MICLIILFRYLLHAASMNVRYVKFNTPLNLLFKPIRMTSTPPLITLFFLGLALLFLEFHPLLYPILLFTAPTNLGIPRFIFKSHKPLLRLIHMLLLLLIFYTATSQTQYILCLNVFILSSLPLMNSFSYWFLMLILLLSGDISENPGPKTIGNYLNFMCWNLNSLSKENFERSKLVEAHNSIYNYDIISLCETSLSDDLAQRVPELDGYSFISANHPDNTRRGGVGIFYKNSLPLTPRYDLAFQESLVVELNLNHKRIFFTVLYRSPAFAYNSTEFNNFLKNFEELHTKIKSEKPYASFFTGDFNGHSKFWWPDGDTNVEGSEMEELFNSLNLTQLISEPTNFTPHCHPSCIDLILTDCPNLAINYGVRPSLDPKCHHQIIHCKVNVKTPPPPPSERKVWEYDRANVDAIQRSLRDFPWEQELERDEDVNMKVKLFNKTILNVMSNFIPNKIRRVKPRQPPWIDARLKSKLNKKNRLFKNFKRHGYREDDKIRLDNFREECRNDIELAKTNYLNSLSYSTKTVLENN